MSSLPLHSSWTAHDPPGPDFSVPRPYYFIGSRFHEFCFDMMVHSAPPSIFLHTIYYDPHLRVLVSSPWLWCSCFITTTVSCFPSGSLDSHALRLYIGRLCSGNIFQHFFFWGNGISLQPSLLLSGWQGTPSIVFIPQIFYSQTLPTNWHEKYALSHDW